MKKIFSYILPVFSAAFLIAAINCGTVSTSASAEDYEIQKNTSYAENGENTGLSSKFSLKIISEEEGLANIQKRVSKSVEESYGELDEAYGIYVDGQFLCAVKDKDIVEKTMTQRLLNYKVSGVIKDMKYSKSIKYIKDIYSKENIISESDAIKKLTAKTYSVGNYVVQNADSIVTVCKKYNMTEEKLIELNPQLEDEPTLKPGFIIKVIETQSFMPIQYIRELETTSFIDYETIEVEISELNVGRSELLVKGQRGEKQNKIEVTYIDGIERSQKVLSSVTTKQPVIEQIGIGTYLPKPASEDIVLAGSGKFSWPVDGGVISDPFISDRNHKGLDIAAPGGTDIYAAADGVVTEAGWNDGGYGYFVMIDHLDGYETLYAHCSGVYATVGQTVKRGQLIAVVGTTGDSTGNHCHFEVREDGICTNPELYINTAG